VGDQLGNPIYEITASYPELPQYYGVLVGMAYTVPYSICGLLSGSLTKEGNRKLLLAGVITTMSLAMCSTGFYNSFGLLIAMRFLHGAISSAINPLSFSIIADIFPPEKRSMANSLLSSASYCGIALSSMTILLIQKFGWRFSYGCMGGLGLVGAAAITFLMKNPKRGQFDAYIDPKQAQKLERE